MKWETTTTDVLVIGGGGAGSRAALEAAARGAEVTLVNKMQFGLSGATAFKGAVIGQYQAVGVNRSEGDSLDRHADDIMRAGAGMADERLVRILVEEAPQQIADLERWGVRFERNGDAYHIIKGCFASVPRSHVLKDHGSLIVRGLEQAVRANERIRVFEHTMIADLIVQEGRCIGALAVNRAGEWTLFEAGAVVMAAGGASRVFESSMYPNDITGDAYALGYEAGATLANMEFVQLGLVTVHPRGGAVNTWTWRMNPHLRNSKGERFLQSYLPDGMTEEEVMALKANHWPFTNSDASSAIEIAVQDQIMRGHHSPRGGIYVDFTHVGAKEFEALPEPFKPVWTMMVDNFKKRKIDLSQEPLEAVVGSHSVNGGYVIDETTMTSVPGLFACGECAAGMHGADRLGGNNLPSGQVFGRRAGYYAAAFALQAGRPQVSAELAGERLDRLQARLSASPNAVRVGDAVARLKQAVSRALCTNRSEEGLDELLQLIRTLRQELGQGLHSRKGHMPICEYAHMLRASELIAVAAKERRETRGPHHRKDHPNMEPGEATNIFLKCGPDGGIRIKRGRFKEASSATHLS